MHKIKNIEKSADRIRKAVANNERIILYGDSDLDGISSVVILEEAIKNLGGRIYGAFFPDRENDGYGINFNILEKLKGQTPALFITLDLGIGNVREIEAANKMGFEVIVVDHHETLASVPNASLIVDPKQKDDPYSFKDLANVGITFKLCLEIVGEKISKSVRSGFAELAALGTIADMVPQAGENQQIIEEGLRAFKNTFRPALRAFMEILGPGHVFDGPPAGGLQKIISALNSAESAGYSNGSYFLLTNPLLEECKKMANELLDKNRFKQNQIREIAEEVDRRAQKNPENPIIFEGDPAWRLTFAGSVASIISQKYQKPVFIYKKGGAESCGSVRNPEGTNSVEAMKSCDELLITYGGHARASGFRIKNEYLENFKENLSKYFKK